MNPGDRKEDQATEKTTGQQTTADRVAGTNIPDSVGSAATNSAPQALLSALTDAAGALTADAFVDLGDVVVVARAADLKPLFTILKEDYRLQFNMLLDLTAVDWLDAKEPRFEVVYHLLSLGRTWRLRVRVPVEERRAEVESLTPLYHSANFMEREVWDMYGIRFLNHPDLRRILLYEEFEGHALRKDYPVQGKQPRIPMRHPEVRNTALDMQRPPLVQINKRTGEEQGRHTDGTVRGSGFAAAT